MNGGGKYAYAGNELELFAAARNYKRYLAGYLKPFVAGHVLEAGSGIGANIPFLMNEAVQSWTCLEPDASLMAKIPDFANGLPLKKIVGTTREAAGKKYNTIVYIDVLEHIEKDDEEMERAAELLETTREYCGRILIVSPAHQHLFSSFDKIIGHFRRYNRDSLAALCPREFNKKIFYIDSAGYLISLGNKMFLQQSIPTLRQISFWDKGIIPLSEMFDRLLKNRFGKTVVAVFEKDCSQDS